jgi:hypothetical protein
MQKISYADPLAGIVNLQNSLNAASEWVKSWESEFNENKFVCIHFGSRNPMHEYQINSLPIPVQLSYKDLGVWISSDLKSSKQCNEAVATAVKLVHLIKRTLRHFDTNTYMLLYKALVRPRVEYASCAWNPHYAKDIAQIEKVQRLATRLVPGYRSNSYEERLTLLGLQSLETRRLRADLILLYQLCHGLVDYDVNLLFDRPLNPSLRGHSFKLRVRVLPKCDTRKFFFANRVVDSWNRLPEAAVSAPNVISFKKALHASGVLPEI